MCGRCHADEHIIGEYFTTPEETQARVAVEQYFETVHGTAITQAGLAVSATCNDCHRGHRVLPASSPESSVNRVHVEATCEQCHIGIRERFEQSAHGRAGPTVTSEGVTRQTPVCTDCHTSHQIVRANEPRWFIGVVEECGSCHERVYDTYFETYHGQVTALGFALTAKCSDCHSPHRMLPASDRESTVHPRNLIRTCSQCHADANWNFVRYYAHGDHRDRERYPVLFWTWALMTTLLVSVWSFFGLHSVLWLGRVGLDRLRGNQVGPRRGKRGNG
jgi:nitrate/TMAO reductase-like tetraheme cytochrome c subunit